MRHGHSCVVYDRDPKGPGEHSTDIEEAVPAEVLISALNARFRSRQEHTFAEKVLSAMRKGFGAHVEPKSAESVKP
jgi:6-phosphogluconate dehydrogenase (decarboxylating)